LENKLRWVFSNSWVAVEEGTDAHASSGESGNGGKFHDSIRKSIFYTNLGADRRGFDRNARIESPKHSLRFQLGHGFGSGMRKKEEPPRVACAGGCRGATVRG
jgi:hypothetical protein